MINKRELILGLLSIGAGSIAPNISIAKVNEWDLLTEAFEVAARYATFEFNDEVTRKAVINAIKPFCDENKFFIKCDEENNSPAVIDRNEFVVSFYRMMYNGTFKVRTYTIAQSSVSFADINKEI